MASSNTIKMVFILLGFFLFFNLVASQPTPTAYVNHTVGGDAGWFFNPTTQKTSADYSSWASKQSFNLGDFLIFNTNTNQTLIQTYNETTYRNCTADYSLDSDTFIYTPGSNELGKSVTIVVPLTIASPQYYFSDGDDGEQCLHGMAFEIKVSRGLGLPPSLNQPPPPAYVPPPAPADEGESPPVTIVGTPTPDGANMGTTMSWMASGLAMLLLHVLIS